MKKNFKKKVLKNGMTILFEKRDLPVVSVVFGVRAGSNNESMEEKGISHFIEHMLYKGTPTRNAKQIAEELEKKGGEINGFTSEEMTGFYCKMPSEHLNVSLDVLSDIIKNPKFDKKEMEKERKVIFEEIKMRHDNPLIYIFDEIQKNLFGGVMDIDVIGTLETMNSIDRDKIVKKFESFYTPNNLILCVVGNATFNEVVDFCEKNFGKEKSNVPQFKIKFKNEIKTKKRGGINQAHLVFGYHVPLAEDEKSYVAKILSALSAEGMSSRLFSEIREKRNLAYAVKGGCDINKEFAYNFIYVGTMKENVEKVKEIILKEFKKISVDLSEKELQQIKEQLIGQHNISMEDSSSQMLNLLGEEISGNAEEFYEFEKKISKVKLKDVKEMASKIKEGKYAFFALVPEK